MKLYDVAQMQIAGESHTSAIVAVSAATGRLWFFGSDDSSLSSPYEIDEPLPDDAVVSEFDGDPDWMEWADVVEAAR